MPPVIEMRALRKLYSAPAARRRVGRSVFPMAGGDASAVAPPLGRSSGAIAALDGLDLDVREGEFFGLLGPNGAGKTTTLGILTTRVRATSGEAFVTGLSVASDAVAVRRRIGVVPQRPNPDRGLNVLENLVFHGTYFGLSRGESTARASRLLDEFDIAEKANASVDDLSGGQQQRLMIARALLHEPSIMFLDEPTVGLDPAARRALWDLLRRLHAEGRTIVMTTHYMQEADELCDRLAIIDHGRLLACDAPERLKAQAPGATLIDLTLDGPAAAAAERCRAMSGVSRVDVTNGNLRAFSDRGGEVIPGLIRAIEDAGCKVLNINLSKPSLETLFISLTGRKLD